MSETKDENQTEEDEILVEAIRYVVACHYPAEGSSKNSQESIKDLRRRWSIIYRKKSDSFVRIVQSSVQESQILAVCYV